MISEPEKKVIESTTVTTIGSNNIRIKDIQLKQGNSICADCFLRDTKFVNLTFGIFLCATCANSHKLVFIDMPERIKSINFNQFANCEVNTLNLGGNKAFNDFVQFYGICPKQTDIHQKYLFEAILYYIKLLHSNAHSHDFKEQRPQIKEGMEPIKVKCIRDYRGFSSKMKTTLKKMFSNIQTKEDEIATKQINEEMIKEINFEQTTGFSNVNSYKQETYVTSPDSNTVKTTTITIEKENNNDILRPTL